MPYQRNLGQVPTSADIRGQVTAPTWADLQSQATTYYRADEGLLSPPYTKALIKESLYSRAGPGTAYDSSSYFSSGAVVTITGQYGNWLQTSGGYYIPLNKTADAVAVAKAEADYKAAAQKVIDDAAAAEVIRLQAEADYKAQADQKVIDDAAAAARITAAIKAAIAKQTPIAIREVLQNYDYPAAGISTSVVMALVKAVVDHLVNLVISQLEGEAK